MGTRFLISFLLGALFFSACSSTKPKKPAKPKPTPSLGEENTDVDFQAFIGRLRKAVHAHDLNTLGSMMTEDFGWRLEPEGSGIPGAFQYWDQNNLWGELEGIISERFVPKEIYMVAPPQFVDPSAQYQGYRAGIRRVNGSWKFAYFVNG